ncbi:MAG: alpha/beta hydrolase [Rhodomicrobium sp.]
MCLALVIGLVAAGIAGAILAGMIAFGAGAPPPPLASIGSAFETVDFSDLPRVQKVAARSGTIGFRQWHAPSSGGPATIVIAIHGSAGSSVSLHPLAKALSAQGIQIYAPDIRGHGETGRRGDIDYAGQLDDDLEDFVRAISGRHPGTRIVLAGFSSGGGFALHAAASRLGGTFGRVVLLAPMLGPKAPTVRETSNAWAAPFIPRIIGLSLLGSLGIHTFEGLPVLAFAIDPAQAKLLTGSWSFRLMRGFGTSDYAADLKNARTPVRVLAAAKDELFDAELFAPTVHAIRPEVPVTVIPDLNHIGMISDARAVPAIAAALRGE